MKLKKVIILLILLVLNCLSSYSKNDSICSPVEGIVFNDSCSVIVPIDYIRLANEKLIERNYLIKVIEQKDLNLIEYNNYVEKQSLMIKDYQKEIQKANEVNQKLQQKLKNQRTQVIVAGGVTAGVVVGAITTILIFTAN